MKPTAQTPEVRHEAERVIEERKADLERARRWLGLRQSLRSRPRKSLRALG